MIYSFCPSYKNVGLLFDKIASAKVPDLFTQSYLVETLVWAVPKAGDMKAYEIIVLVLVVVVTGVVINLLIRQQELEREVRVVLALSAKMQAKPHLVIDGFSSGADIACYEARCRAE